MKARALWLAFLIICAARPSAADDFAAPVSGHAGVTDFDLLKLLVADLKATGKDEAVGHKVVPFQHIEGKDSTGEPSQEIKLRPLDVATMKIPGDDSRIVLLVDIGQQEGFVAEANLLALFSLTPTPKLLDVVEVGQDRTTVFVEKSRPLMLAPKTPLILVESGHNDSDEDFTSTEMIFVRDDRFQLIDAFSTLDVQLCAYKHTQTPSYAVVPDAGPYAALHVSVLQRVSPSHENCGQDRARPRRVATYQAIYRWDDRRQAFVTLSRQLKDLGKENAKPL